MTNFDTQYSLYQKAFEEFLNQKISLQESIFPDYCSKQIRGLYLLKNHTDLSYSFSEKYPEKLKTFYTSIKYSLQSGGKRFRPVLTLATADLLGTKGGKDVATNNQEKVLPVALAIEMIHTYSLIHDDLPCMDNDDERRGKPSNHKAFGEPTALLAGDALLTEAFGVLSESSNQPQKMLKVIRLFSECAGTLGMIGGQYVDLIAQKNKVNIEELSQMQINKTGALIRASIMGAAILCDATEKEMEALENFSQLIGLSFQIADDILDKDKNELASFVQILGLEGSKDLLEKLTHKSIAILRDFKNSQFMIELSEFNSKRLS